MMLLIQEVPAPRLRAAGIKPRPDFWITVNEKLMAGEPEQQREIQQALQRNVLTITTKRVNYAAGWVPKTTIRSNNAVADVEHIHLEFQVYDRNKNLIWESNLLVERLKPGATFKAKPPDPDHLVIPISVPSSSVEVTKIYFKMLVARWT
jgi:hypothetical protein